MKIYDLSGVWKLCLDEEKQKTGIEKIEFTDSITLPGTTDLARKGRKNDNQELGFLTQEYIFEGYAWYQKTIKIEECDVNHPMKLYLERTRKTKLWINGSYVGDSDSMVAPHIYEITDFIKNNTIELLILVDNTEYKTKGGHMTSPDTQTNWNGIIGKMELRVYQEVYINNVQVYTEIADKTATAKLQIENTTNSVRQEEVRFQVKDNQGNILKEQIIYLLVNAGKSDATVQLKLPEEVQLWSEYTPELYTLEVTLVQSGEQSEVTFGVREFRTTEDKFLVNGQETFLRGKSEALLFPLTGCSPMTVEEWMKIMGIARSYGINHYRCHTCCLPDAAFEAADRLGIYVQPEISFWGTITEPGEEGYCEEEQEYLFQEGNRILEAYGNHPSFVMLTLGNELWGSEKRMNSMMKAFREKDDRHLYAQGCNNFMWVPKVLEEDDFFIGVRTGSGKLIRGSFAKCDAPQGFVQTMAPAMNQNYDLYLRPDLAEQECESLEGQEQKSFQIQYGTGVKTVSGTENSDQLIPHVPVINHEIGQYTTYPDYQEIEKYTGVLKPRNLMVFNERLEEKGMLDLDELFFLASGKLSGSLYQMEIEAALRTKYLAGYQLLDLQDFTGQGTALVGILDSLMEEKGTVSQEEWKRFCNEIVLLAEFDSFVLTNGEKLEAKLMISNYSNHNLYGNTLEWELVKLEEMHEIFEYGTKSEILKQIRQQENEKRPIQKTEYMTYQKETAVVKKGFFVIENDGRGLFELQKLIITLPESEKPQKYCLKLQLKENAEIHNQYEFWSYPKAEAKILTVTQLMTNTEQKQNEVIVTSKKDVMLQCLEQGEKVLYLPNGDIDSIPGEYATDFWNYPMFRSISEGMKKPLPIGTMGLLIENEHPLMQYFPSEIYTTPQWYQMIMNSDYLILDDERWRIRPIVQMIDNFERNHRLGMVLELQAGKGKVLVCTTRFDGILNHPEVQCFVKALRTYMDSDDFCPESQLSLANLEELLSIHSN